MLGYTFTERIVITTELILNYFYIQKYSIVKFKCFLVIVQISILLQIVILTSNFLPNTWTEAEESFPTARVDYLIKK